MNYKYTITETHSNKKADDYSSVLLHDAPVKSVRYENGDVILTVESIIVLPNREPNETNRYLSTGEAEIRIANTTLPDGFPMGEVNFDLNAHEYNTNYTPHIFRLSAFIPGYSRAVWYHFPCDSVTYSFDEFTGDSYIQKARDADRKILARCIEKGHGRAWMLLKGMPSKVRDENLDLIIYAATHDMRFDHQCDESRVQFVMDLISLYDGKRGGKNTKEHILNILMLQSWRSAWSDAVNPDDFAHCIDMILANREHPLAEETLAYLESKLTETSNEQKLEILHRKTGKLPPDEDFPTTEMRPVQQEFTMERIIEICRGDTGLVHPARFRHFFETSCTSDDIAMLLDAARSEQDPKIRGRLYSMFAKLDFPGEPEEIIAMARESEGDLAGGFTSPITPMNLQRAVSRLRHPAVLAYRDELLKKAETAGDEMKDQLLCCAIDHWVNNYTYSWEEDAALADFLNNLPEDKYGPRHHAAFALTNSRMYAEPFDVVFPYQHLYWVIFDTHCPNCRRKALELLHRFTEVHKTILQTFLHDSESQTRTLVRQWLNQ